MTSMMDLYQKKYTILKRKCEELHQTNEKLVNRIHHVKKLLKRYKRERSLMVEELDRHGDDFREVEIPPMYELPDDLPGVDDVTDGKEDNISTEPLLIPKTEKPELGSELVTTETLADTSPSLAGPNTNRPVMTGR